MAYRSFRKIAAPWKMSFLRQAESEGTKMDCAFFCIKITSTAPGYGPKSWQRYENSFPVKHQPLHINSVIIVIGNILKSYSMLIQSILNCIVSFNSHNNNIVLMLFSFYIWRNWSYITYQGHRAELIEAEFEFRPSVSRAYALKTTML
jgi:hypothetical protein